MVGVEPALPYAYSIIRALDEVLKRLRQSFNSIPAGPGSGAKTSPSTFSPIGLRERHLAASFTARCSNNHEASCIRRAVETHALGGVDQSWRSDRA